MSISVPRGFRLAGVHCGVKKNPQKQDLALIVSDKPAVAVGVYTQNLVYAACVGLNRSRTPSERIRTVVINSGNANACTGERGDRDAQRMGELAAAACGAKADQALVLSTGVIGEFLPMEKIEAGIQHLKKLLTRYDLPSALAAYNAGEAAVDRFGGVPPFRETQNYVSRILRLLNRS